MIKRHYEKHYKARYQERAHLVFLLDTILVSIALALLGLSLYFRWFYHPLRDDFKMSVVTEEVIVAGQETGFEVRIINGGTTDLHDGRLTLHLPTAFIPKEAPDAFDAARGSIAIPALPAHASASYSFHGTLLGPAQTAKVYAHFTATAQDGRSDEKLITGDLKWEANAIETRFELPEAVVPGQSAAFKLHVKNGTAFAFEKAFVTPNWPVDFKLQNATPPVYRGTIQLGRLEAGEETVLEFAGRFGGKSDPMRFAAQLNGTLNSRTLTLAVAHTNVRLADAGLKLEASFADDPAYLKPGQEAKVTVRYRNEGTETIKDLTLSFAPDPRALSGVRWETSPNVGTLAPGKSGERTAFVRVLDVISQYAVNPILHAIPQATFSIDEPRVSGVQVVGSGAETKVAGAVRLRTIARFFTSEGDQLGRGPLPPKVGKTTRYWIFASLETGGTQVQDGLASFRLPAGVAWTGRATVTAGDDLKLEGDRLVWRLGTTDAHAGLLLEAPSASFEVALTPASDQAGKSPLLLAEAAYSGQDTWTGEALTAFLGGLNTQLPGDPAVAGRTNVMP